MSRQYHIKIKFCGGCNPEIDRGSLAGRFKELVDKSSLKNRIIFDDGNDIIIMINGCPHACLDEDKTLVNEYANSVSVHGKMIEFTPSSENILPGILLQKLAEIIK